MEIGGSRTSLHSLLSIVNPNIAKIDVFVRDKKGALLNKMPNCTILPDNIWLSHRIYNGSLIARMLCYLLYYFRGCLKHFGVNLFRLYGFIGGKQIHSEEYDIVVGFDETMTRVVCNYPAKKRAVWMHCDYRRFVKGTKEKSYFKKNDNIVFVSEFAKHAFLEVFPEYESKSIVIPNAINVDYIIDKSKQTTPEIEALFSDKDSNPFTIISIGRLDPIKQFHKIPAIASEVKSILCGVKKFQWLIIGGGNNVVRSQIESEIEKFNVGNEVKLIGMQPNPYPYLAKSDLNVCTSLSETFSYTIHEGLVLKIPFLCNTFPYAASSIKCEGGGFIIPLDDMPMKIVELIHQPLTINSCIISNDEVLDCFYKLI